MSQHVICGDSAVVLGHFPDDHFHAVICDPPHALGAMPESRRVPVTLTREECEAVGVELPEGVDEIETFAEIPEDPEGGGFMGAKWDRLPAQPIWDECFRVLKPGGHVWLIGSDRWGTAFGFGLGLKRAGFLIDESQMVGWVQLQGMPKSTDIAKNADKEAFRAWLLHVGRETVGCPDHKEEKDVDRKPVRCAACERVFAEGKLTQQERRKAESAAVNGCYSSAATRETGTYYYEAQGQERPWYTEQRSGKLTADDLLSSLLSLHWPSSPSSQRAQWEAVVGEVPEGWDVSRPPGVRVKTGRSCYANRAPNAWQGGGKNPCWEGGDQGPSPEYHTSPSTPLAAEWDGWRGSVAPFRPLLSLILHAVKPHSEGTYLRCAEEHGTGSVAIEDCRIPFAGSHPAELYGPSYMRSGHGKAQNELQAISGNNREGVYVNEGGRVPGNLLTYASLLGSLTHQADLDAWAERLGLPTASAELLEAGLCYAPKPSRAEKEKGLDGDFEHVEPKQDTFGLDRFRCATCHKWIEPPQSTHHQTRPDAMCVCEEPIKGETQKQQPRANRHPTCKPVSLCAFLVALSTREGDRVLDPFLGSGTTLVAAKMLGREGVGVELDESYCAIARARIEAAKPLGTSKPGQGQSRFAF